jgi:hypothetical protein
MAIAHSMSSPSEFIINQFLLPAAGCCHPVNIKKDIYWQIHLPMLMYIVPEISGMLPGQNMFSLQLCYYCLLVLIFLYRAKELLTNRTIDYHRKVGSGNTVHVR